ncbi:DASH complex subunit Dad4, partial [Nadsonia fulvescens var. elongata DSM 6958]
IENPYEQAQNALFERIVNNMAKLNDVVKEANRGLTEINMKNMNVELTVQMWQKYERNASFYLHETNQ